jgi:hypothetical protein
MNAYLLTGRVVAVLAAVFPWAAGYLLRRSKAPKVKVKIKLSLPQASGRTKRPITNQCMVAKPLSWRYATHLKCFCM